MTSFHFLTAPLQDARVTIPKGFVLVVANVFHLTMMEAACSWEPSD